MLLLIWLLFGVASAMIASSKGRSGCGYFALGVLLGPFGIIFALIAGKDEKKVERDALSTGDVKKCPYCAEIIKREAIRCRYCGADLTAGPRQP